MKICLVSLFLFSHTLFAAESMKPGLWEHSFTMKSQSGKVEKAMAEAKKQLASMPAEQRKMMEEMMAKNGLGLSGTNTVKVCISKEQAEKLDFPQNQMDNCNQEVVSRTSDSLKMKFTCTKPHASSGEAEFKLTGSTSYTGKATINTETDGKPDVMNMDSKGKWLAADCGNIKSLPSKK